MNQPALKEEFINKRIQQIEIAEDGAVIASDDVIFSIAKNIGALHPFFEGIIPLLKTLDQHITFPCVNVVVDKNEKILDVEVLKKEERYFLLLFDFTQHYKDAHPLVQEKNEAAIAKDKLAFEKRLLLAKESFKNNFLANLNHDIRNPLNNMLGFMELLRDTKLTYDQNETLKVMQRTGTQIKQLMEDMLDISKIERGVIELQHVPFNLGHITTNLQQHFQLKFGAKHSHVEVIIDDGVPKKLLGDPVRINQILFNLLDNASKHADKQQVILRISAKEKSEENCVLLFAVSDQGKGISEDQLDKVFDSYYQLKENDVKPLGEGLGLKIVKDLVTLLDGNIAVASDTSGTVFTCELPFTRRTLKEKRPSVPKGTGLMLSKRILIIENEETSQMLFMRMFLNNEHGFIIEIASDAKHAFSLIEKRKYNLILIKSKLPDISADTFIEQHMSNENADIESIPILVVSGSTMLQEQQAMLDVGAAGFLAKPYTQKELFDTIEKLHT